MFGIADHEQPPREQPLSTQQPHDVVLDGIGVLKLVDHQQGNACSQAPPGFGMVAKQVPGAQQQVVEIDEGGFPLAFVVKRADPGRRPQCAQPDLCAAHQMFRIIIEQLLKLFNRAAQSGQ